MRRSSSAMILTSELGVGRGFNGRRKLIGFCFLHFLSLFSLAAWLKASAVPLGFSFLILGFFQYMLWTLNQLEKKTD